MDQFYLDNVPLYQALVKEFRPDGRIEGPKANAETTSPDITVSARIRPLLEDDIAAGFPRAVYPRSAQPGVADIHDLYNHPRGRPVLKSFNYEVDRLFNSQTTTEEIYDEVMADLVPFAWYGGIGTLFAYGQTGSGKTYTVSRLEQLAIESLMNGSLDGKRQVHITIIELAGNSAFDLLNSRKPISILEDSFGVTQLSGALELAVQDKDDVSELVERAAAFRRTAPTLKNDASSRSHGICRIRIEDTSADSDGLLYLVDLAGSEAARDVAIHGADRMRETREINMSLSVLKDCIRGKVQSDALALSRAPKSKQKKPHIPFRQSSLTKVLKHVFDPAGTRACKTAVVACINPSLADVGPSKNTLRYAELLRILVPSSGSKDYNAMAPVTWGNAQLQIWIASNSGSPPIQPNFVAPTETGAQLLRLPAKEFERRCLKTPGVTVEDAKAFRGKLWQMHLDSQRTGGSTGTSTGTSTPLSRAGGEYSLRDRQSHRPTSRDLPPLDKTIPFQERIRPGMVVRWNSQAGVTLSSISSTPTNGTQLAIILSPVQSMNESGSVDKMLVLDAQSAQDAGQGVDRARQYLCAAVNSGLTPDAFEVNLWQQLVIDVKTMEKEVFMEYDPATRYYYITV